MFALGRWTTRVPFAEWLDHAAHPQTVRLVPVDRAVALELTRLPSSFHRDPADRIIVASARARKLPLLTQDRRIVDSQLTARWHPPKP